MPAAAPAHTMELVSWYQDTSRGRPFAKDPAVVWFGQHAWLYYSLPPFGDGRADDGWRIGIARSADLRHWQRVGELQPAHPCEARGLCAPGVLLLDGRMHLFYQTYGNGRADAICHAVSDDGITFVRHPANPILRATGAWNAGRLIDADVVRDGDDVVLYGATRDPAMAQQMLVVARAPLRSGFGREHWRQHHAPILRPELAWERDCIEAPAVCRRAGRWVMFYAGAWNNEPQQIGVALSDDGIAWRRLGDRPWLANGAPGQWNASESGHPFLFAAPDGRDLLFFQGNADGGATWSLAAIEVHWIDGVPTHAGRH
jgi:hypothetical protein